MVLYCLKYFCVAYLYVVVFKGVFDYISHTNQSSLTLRINVRGQVSTPLYHGLSSTISSLHYECDPQYLTSIQIRREPDPNSPLDPIPWNTNFLRFNITSDDKVINYQNNVQFNFERQIYNFHFDNQFARNYTIRVWDNGFIVFNISISIERSCFVADIGLNAPCSLLSDVGYQQPEPQQIDLSPFPSRHCFDTKREFNSIDFTTR
eukprot:m.56337 g.56337  ORF g.56337 m.56337 type:complete len:206 (-) comp11187_c0_seq4:115-732(-)